MKEERSPALKALLLDPKASLALFLADQTKGERLVYLWERWQDEKKYEDFDDYSAEMARLIPQGWVFLQGNKKPFGFTVKCGKDSNKGGG